MLSAHSLSDLEFFLNQPKINWFMFGQGVVKYLLSKHLNTVVK